MELKGFNTIFFNLGHPRELYISVDHSSPGQGKYIFLKIVQSEHPTTLLSNRIVIIYINSVIL